LPAYMLPAIFVQVCELPLTPHGKVDRRALAIIEGRLLDRGGERAVARTPTEELLSQLWADLLHREQVGIHDDFFELGGHSLLAMQMLARIREIFSIELSVRILFEVSTISGLAEIVAQKLAEQLDDDTLLELEQLSLDEVQAR